MRARPLNDHEPREGEMVLYWMTAARRSAHNHALDHALAIADERELPLLVFEPLRIGYEWACPRFHRWVMDGMEDNAKAFAKAGISYLSYVEPEPDADKGLLEALAKRAAAVVCDDYPAFFLPRMLASAEELFDELGVHAVAVDANGLYPLADTDRVFTTAASFRRHLQKRLPTFDGKLFGAPAAKPRSKRSYDVPDEITERWPSATELPKLTGPGVVDERGGREAGLKLMKRFLDERLAAYGDGRNHPDDDASSGLSPYLHFGHVASHEVFADIVRREDWSRDDLAEKPNGSRNGWWGMSPSAEAFVDELLTWRELGFNGARHMPDFEKFAGLPDWAKKTLDDHRDDTREVYTLERLDAADTDDPIWNAAQRELRQTGRMHNYLRMLWGKRVLEWSSTPEECFERLVELNNRYAIDGRDPNSYSGIGWVLGRYDRAWGPERPVFGKVRYMSSASTKRKLRLRAYLEQFGPES